MLKNKITIIILIAVIFGFFSGAVGSLVARVYLFERLLEIPLFGDIDLSKNPLNQPNVVISGARNVVVEQDAKVADTITAVENSIVGIYEKKVSSTRSIKVNTKINLNDWYKLDDILGQGFIITSDGWIVSAFSSKAVIKRQAHDFATTSIDKLAQKYVIINSNKKILTVDRIIYDSHSQLSFYHVVSNNLPVKSFTNLENIHSGQLLVAVNWRKQGWLTTVLRHKTKNNSEIWSSDDYQNFYELEQTPPDLFKGAFLFTLDNGLAAIINNDGLVFPVDNFLTCFNCLLNNNIIKRPKLGINYIDLNDYIQIDSDQNQFGVLVMDSSVDVFDLRIGDIILAVDNIELKSKKQLSAEINKRLPGDELMLSLKRNNEIIEIKVILKSIEVTY